MFNILYIFLNIFQGTLHLVIIIHQISYTTHISQFRQLRVKCCVVMVLLHHQSRFFFMQ